MDNNAYLPPQNVEAEQSVLGAILLDNDSLRKRELLGCDDFYKDAHRKIFRAMIDLFDRNEPIDIITLTDDLKRKNELEAVGGSQYISSLVSMIPTAANIRYHARIVKETSLKRTSIRACLEFRSNIQDLPLDEALTRFRSQMQALVTGRGGNIVSMVTVTQEIYEFVEQRSKHRGCISGIPSGFEDIDKMTDGFQNGDLIILAARPGMGKSALSMAIAHNAGVPIGVVSLEMGSHQIGIRSLSSLSQVELWKLRKGIVSRELWDDVVQATARMAEKEIYFSFTSRNTSEIEKVITQMVEVHSIKLLIVDYLQLARSTEQKNREREIAEISRLLKTMAQVHNIPVIALAQLNREVEKREDKRPVLADLRDSGQIEQDADVVMFLYREKNDGEDILSVNFAKGRNIGLGTVKLIFEKDTMTFRDFKGP